MRTAALCLLCTALVGCNLEVTEVIVSGIVLDEPYFEGQPVAGVEATSLDAMLEPYSTVTSDANGLVSLPVAAAQDMFIELRGPGYAPTLFAGEAGIFDLPLSDGELYMASDTRAAELTAEFGDCASDATGGIIEGEVRVWMAGEQTSDVSLVGNAWVMVYGTDNEEFTPCFLDAEGDPAPESQTLTNSTGRFAFFGLPPDSYVLEVAFRPGGTPDDPPDSELDAYYWYYKAHMVEDGIAPFHPAWVEFAT